jgi:hypothetical protein
MKNLWSGITCLTHIHAATILLPMTAHFLRRLQGKYSDHPLVDWL